MVVKLELELEEVNGCLVALGNLPFNQVAPLIRKIQEQANSQMPPPEPQPEPK